MTEKFDDLTYFEGETAWNLPGDVDIAIPCATQNELDEEDALKLIEKGVTYVGEGANMPCTPEAIQLFRESNVIFAPGKAVKAGGVAASGLEMAQNALQLSWEREKVEEKLLFIMKNIHEQCVAYGKNDKGATDYVRAANLAGFVKIADAMLDQGAV